MITGKKIILTVVFLLFAFSASAYNLANKKVQLVIEPAQKTLKVGEKLQYSIQWLGIYVGKIILNIEEIKQVNGKECYHIVGIARPNRILSKLYNFEYTVHAYIDTTTNYAVRFEKIRRLNDKKHYVIIDFDRENKVVRYQESGFAPVVDISAKRTEAESSVPSTLNILNGTQDLFSGLYHLRMMDMKEGQNCSIDIYYDKRSWPLKVKVGKPYQKDIRKKGSFVVFETSLTSELGNFILGKSKMSVVFTADARRIPVQFRFGTSAGSIKGVIKSMSY